MPLPPFLPPRELTPHAQFVDNHVETSPSAYTAKEVKLPDPADIPNVDLHVINYHKPPLGTFHGESISPCLP